MPRVTVEVDAFEVLDDLSDTEVIMEIKARMKRSASFKAAFERDFVHSDLDRDYAQRALEHLIAGRVSSAIAHLDRALYPTIVKPAQTQEVHS